VTLVAALPARLVWLPFAFLLAPALWLAWASRKRLPRRRRSGGAWLAAVCALSLASGAFTMILLRPDHDDLTYFHRALAQLEELDRPFFTGDTVHNVPGLPPASVLHVMTSYEPMVALGARLAGVPPLAAYHLAVPFLAGTLLPLVYLLLYRRLRLGRGLALAATAVALLFLVEDGGTHRSFGNVAYVRLWQGKTILWTLLIPATLLLAQRFLQRPTRSNLAFVAMAAVSGVGLSNSGVYLMPLLLLSLGAAHLLSRGVSRRRLAPALLLGLAGFYPLALAGALVTGWLPQPSEEGTLWRTGFPAEWWRNLLLVLGDGAGAARDGLLLLAFPALAPRGPLRRLLPLLAGMVCVLAVNPVAGPLWMELIWPASYWRMAYLFPVPLCAGLLVCAWPLLRPRRPALRLGVGLLVLLAAWSAHRRSVLSPENRTTFKAPGEYRFFPRELAFARAVAPRLHGKRVLASEEVVVVLALLDASIRFEAARPGETLHAFLNAGLREEGERRVAAQNLVAAGWRRPGSEAALLRSLEGSIDALIVGREFLPADVMAAASSAWEEAQRDAYYVLLLRRPRAGG
jgi:hypothetical protein